MRHVRRYTFIAITAFAGVAALAGCTAEPPAEAQATPSQAPSVVAAPATAATEAPRSIANALAHATYPIDVVADGNAPLHDGVYEASIPDSSSKTVVRLGPDPAFGDLDGDGQEDAAVTLLASSGGSGSFTYIAAVMNRSGVAAPLPAVAVGDRISVSSLAIVDGVIIAAWLERNPNDPMSTPPSVSVEKRFVVRDGMLIPVAEAPAQK